MRSINWELLFWEKHVDVLLPTTFSDLLIHAQANTDFLSCLCNSFIKQQQEKALAALL